MSAIARFRRWFAMRHICRSFRLTGNGGRLRLSRIRQTNNAAFVSRHRAMIAVLIATLGACDRSASGPVLIGAAGPWDAAYGLMNRRGIELAVAEINRSDAGRKQPLQVIYQNDEADGQKAIAIAEGFVANDSVLAVVGHVNSGTMVAAAKVYDGHLVAVSTTATSPDISGISPWVFRVISSDSVNGIDLARFARRLGRSRAAILYENDSYGRGLASAFQRSFSGTVVSVDPISDAPQNFEPWISYFRLRKPDIVFVATTDAAGRGILAEARKLGFDADFLGGDGWTGIVADTAIAEGAYVGAPFTSEDPRPEARRFVSAFRTRYQATPDGNAALAYDATMLIWQAIRSGGATRKGIRTYLAGLTEETAHHGVTGTIRFQESGDPVGKGFVMTRVRNGALPLVPR